MRCERTPYDTYLKRLICSFLRLLIIYNINNNQPESACFLINAQNDSKYITREEESQAARSAIQSFQKLHHWQLAIACLLFLPQGQTMHFRRLQ